MFTWSDSACGGDRLKHWLFEAFTLNLSAMALRLVGGSFIATTLQCSIPVVGFASLLFRVFLLSWRVPWRSK